MTKIEFNKWVFEHGIQPHTEKIISQVRDNDPFRRVGYWLKDVAWSLDKNLRKRHKASASATFAPGCVEFDIVGAEDLTVLEPYMTSLQVAMNKERFRVLIEYG